MVADHLRNTQYYLGIDRAVKRVLARKLGTKTCNVIDYGSGSGLLSLMAARAGATRVTGIEHMPHVAKVAGDVTAMNGYASDVVSFLAKDIRKVKAGRGEDLKEKQDMLVMELFDYGFLGEGCLHFVHHAWNHCLKPDAVVVPGGGAVFAMPVQVRECVCICKSGQPTTRAYKLPC